MVVKKSEVDLLFKEAIGKSVGGPTTKIHAAVDALGNPLRFILTPGQQHDVTVAEDLIEWFSPTSVLADKAYDSDKFTQLLESKGIIACIPPKKNRLNPRTYDKHQYKNRHLIENFFEKLKFYRKISMRYEKLEKTFLGLIYLVSAKILMR